MRRRDRTIHPSARIGVPTATGRRKSTAIRAVTPQLSSATSAHAMTSSRIPPWTMPSQPSKRRSSASSTHERPGSRWRSSPRPPVLRVPQAKQLWGANSKRPAGVSIAGRARVPVASDVKVLHLARLGLDEVLPRPDLLAHQHREDLVGQRGILAVHLEQRPRLGVHSRLPELIGVYLSEA